MAGFNQVTLVGNLTRDVEVKYLQSGSAVCEMGLAVNERVKRKDGWEDQTTFVDVTLFGRTAEVAGEYLEKGSPVLIVGKLKLDQWEQDGKKRSKLKVVGDQLQMLGSKGERRQQNQYEPEEHEQAAPSVGAPPPPTQEDSPF